MLLGEVAKLFLARKHNGVLIRSVEVSFGTTSCQRLTCSAFSVTAAAGEEAMFSFPANFEDACNTVAARKEGEEKLDLVFRPSLVCLFSSYAV